MPTLSWTGTLTAQSSIVHGGQTRGTCTLLRRELICTPAGQLVHVPIISGNTLRGRLRRVGEELLRDVLGYEGLLKPAAAHALRGGGSLAKTGAEPLTGGRLQTLRALVPQIGVFGAAGGGTIIGGALDVGKVLPAVAETSHITGVATDRSAFTATQLESYTRQSDTDAHDFSDVLQVDATARLKIDETGEPELVNDPGGQMLFHIETFPAGTVFTTWLRLRRPSPLEAAFFREVLDHYRTEGRLGGRVAIGHGRVSVDLRGSHDTDPTVDWRSTVLANRDEALQALESLS